MKNKKTWFYCHHCGKRWSELYLAELCFKIDMDNAEKEITEIPLKKRELKTFKNGENKTQLGKTGSKRI